MHVRIDFPLADHPERLRPFLTEAAQLVAGYGGSISGEHGDGRARSELLPIMYSRAAIEAFAAFKGLFDPDGLLNPGVIVDARPVAADLRLPAARPLRAVGGFALAADDGDLSRAVHRCVGMGKCRADNGPAGGFMCPSYLATRDEKDSTRGRARVLQELANGTLVTGGWRAPEVHEALDLCLSCKACSRDCPVSVDMATYKSEVLHQAYRGRLRPRSHYALGWLPRWTRLAAAAPGLATAALRLRPVTGIARRLAGIDPRRPLPGLARHPATPSRLRRQLPAAVLATTGATPARDRAVIWADTFTRAFSPQVAEAAVAVLAEAGFEVIVPDRSSCCGLTWISTGQLRGARARLRAAVAGLAPYAEQGVTIVGLEPSCTAVLRGDLTDLLDGDPRARAVAAATRTLAETLLSAGRGARPGAGAGPPGARGLALAARTARGEADHRPAALPPSRRPGLRRRPGRAARGGRRRRGPGRVLRPGGQLRHGARPLRGVGGRRGAGAAAGVAGGPGRDAAAGRRVLLPRPGQPARRLARAAPRRTARPTARRPPLANGRPAPPPGEHYAILEDGPAQDPDQEPPEPRARAGDRDDRGGPPVGQRRADQRGG